MKTSEKLRAAKAKIADPANWCQLTFAMDANGEPCDPRSGEAVQWCAIGAIDSFNWFDLSPEDYLRRASLELFGAVVGAANDCLGHSAVMRVYDRAIEMAEAEEGSDA